MTLNALVTASGSAISQGIIKSLKMSGLDCDIVTTDNSPYAAGLYTGKAGYIVPLAKEEGFLDSITGICKNEGIDVILIGTDYELALFSRNKKRIEEETGAYVMVSPKEVIAIADDKWLTHRFLEDHGFPTIPSTLEEGTWDLVDQVGFPLVVKPRIGDSSKNVMVVKNKNELEDALEEENPSENPFLKDDPGRIIQMYAGEAENEFTSTTVTLDGECRGVLSMNRRMRFGGHTTIAFVTDFPRINTVIKDIAEKLSPLGPCNFQSRIMNGIPYVFEINCRFSGTTPLCAQVGFNTVEASVAHYVLRKKIPELKHLNGVFLRYFNEIFVPEETVTTMENEGVVRDPKYHNNEYF